MENSVLIDYLSFTFTFETIFQNKGLQNDYLEDSKHPFILNLINLLGYKEEEVSEFEYGRNRFQTKIVLGENTTILFNGPNDSKGDSYNMLEMTGSACRDFERRNGNWFNLLDFLVRHAGLHFTRLDLAADLKNHDVITIEWLRNKILKREIITPFNKYSMINSGDYSDPEGSNSGNTIYLGSIGSNKRLAIYDKLVEQLVKGNEHLLKAWIRFEIRFGRENANKVANDLLNGELDDFGNYFSSILFSLLDIKKRAVDLSRKNNWKTMQVWSRFIGNVKKYEFKNQASNEDATLLKTKEWVTSNISRSLCNIVGDDYENALPTLISLFIQRISDLNGEDFTKVNKSRVLKGKDPFPTLDEYKKTMYDTISKLRSTKDFSDFGLDDLD